MNEEINYRKGSPELRQAFYTWKKLRSEELNKQAVPFTAGWNAAMDWVKKNIHTLLENK